MRFDAVGELLARGVDEGVYPGAVALVASGPEVLWRMSVGAARLRPDREGMTLDTVFDLASLTKPLATATVAMALSGAGRLDVSANLGALMGADWLPPVKRSITLRHILTHSAGFPDVKPFWAELMMATPEMRRPLLMEKVFEQELEFAPGSDTLYSDVGFLALQTIVEYAGQAPLDVLFEELVAKPLQIERLGFRPFDTESDPEPAPGVAATWDDPGRGLLWGRVEDENAYFLGGVAAHAGLFGTASEVHRLLAALLFVWQGTETGFFKPEVVREFFTVQGLPPESDWALGFDTPSKEGSSSGHQFSPRAVGHTGYTGAAFWMDLPSGLIAILLTNRTHPDRERQELLGEFRPRFFDAVWDAP